MFICVTQGIRRTSLHVLLKGRDRLSKACHASIINQPTQFNRLPDIGRAVRQHRGLLLFFSQQAKN